MKDAQNGTATQRPEWGQIREHLVKAQELMDAINPDSVFGARLQQLIDELEEPTAGSAVESSSEGIAR